MNLKMISVKLGFTETEFKVSLFLIAILLSALGLKYYLNNLNSEKYLEYDYSAEDSLFYSTSGLNKDPEQLKEYAQTLNLNNVEEYKRKSLPAEKSININQADVNKLMMLPGIGEKTAKAIIEIRRKKVKFSNINELLAVKGIGEIKLNKIKKFIYIE